MSRATLAFQPTIPAPSPVALAADMQRLVTAAEEIARIGSAGRTDRRRLADSWKDATAHHFVALARAAEVVVTQVTLAMFCAELDRRACS